MTFKTFTDGEVLYAANLNADFSAVNSNLLLNYTGTGFNASRSNSNGTTNTAYELTAIPAASLTDKVYLKIIVTTYNSCVDGSGNSSSTALKIESKYVGGSYNTDLSQTLLSVSESNTIGTTQTVIFVHTLTANEIANGLQLQLTGSATCNYGSGSSSASISNVQVTVFATR